MARGRTKVCAVPGCPTLTTSTHCPPHARQVDRARGTRQQRGYDAEHDRRRREWVPKVATGTIPCARCGLLIAADEAWDLGHTDDRTGWTGPEHANRCNRAAGGRASTTQGGG